MTPTIPKGCVDCGRPWSAQRAPREFPASRYEKRGRWPNEYPVTIGPVCWLCDLYGRRVDSFTRYDWQVLLTWRSGRWPRSQRWRWLGRLIAHRWRRWTALPGDVFVAPERDVYYTVHSGRPGHLKGWRTTGLVYVSLLRDGLTVDAAAAAFGDKPQPIQLP